MTEKTVFAGKYVIERVIGEGGMCVVFAAQHARLNHRIAIKVLRPDVPRDAEAIDDFTREARAAARIRSEHVARVLDIDVTDDGEPFIVMEWLEGSDFEDLLFSSGTLPVTAAVDYLLQAGEAVAEAHALGIVHRDLKPANLFFTRRADGSPCIKVLDFGIATTPERARLDAALVSGQEFVGSPQYMSPEQLAHASAVDTRADLWSLGVILYELLAGEPPFSGDSVTEVCAQILVQRAPLLSQARRDVPARLEKVVLRCLEKQPERRFATVAQLAEALAEFASAAGRLSVRRITGVVARANREPSAWSEAIPWGRTDVSPAASLARTRPRGVRAFTAAATLAVAASGSVFFTSPATLAQVLTATATAIAPNAAASERQHPNEASSAALRSAPPRAPVPRVDSVSEAPRAPRDRCAPPASSSCFHETNER